MAPDEIDAYMLRFYRATLKKATYIVRIYESSGQRFLVELRGDRPVVYSFTEEVTAR